MDRFLQVGLERRITLRSLDVRFGDCHAMLYEDNDIAQSISSSHCQAKYGHYGLFATYPLRTAVLNSEAYDLVDFIRTFERSGENHRPNPKFAEYVDSLVYEDKNYFTVDETRFLLRLLAPCEALSNEQIESDLRAITADVKRGRNMVKSHARILSKAISYWKMHYNDRYERWLQEFIEADEAWLARRQSGQLDGCQYFYCRECDGELSM